MTQCARILDLLADGAPHSHHEEDCLLWEGYVAPHGYGMINRYAWGNKPRLAHRVAYEQANGLIPECHELHHLCGNKTCIRVSHLQLVTRAEHRAIEREGRTHCKRGHPYAKYGKNHHGRAAIYCTVCKALTNKLRQQVVADA